jgi:hypothetical protein
MSEEFGARETAPVIQLAVRQDTQQGALTFEMEGLLYLP